MRHLLRSLLQGQIGRTLLNWGLAHMTFALPVRRLRETDTLLAFYHPQPSYPVHIVLVPKRPVATLLDLPADDTAFLRDLVQTVQDLVRELGLEERGYRLIANGGAYQDVPQCHFHLIADRQQKPGTGQDPQP
jgi:histidine triad (HIT) family protein